MNGVLFLILFPLIPALLCSVAPKGLVRNIIVRLFVAALIGASIYFGLRHLSSASQFFIFENPLAEKVILYGEIILTLFLLFCCRKIKLREIWIPLLIIIEAAILFYCELGLKIPKVETPLYVDNFSIVLSLIIGIIGSLICVYALSYMEDYHHHHKEIKDHSKSFFFTLFLFLSAMFGIVFSNHLVWLFFFWEITTLCSFLLIGYSKTEEATRNAFHALGLNLLGGLTFILAILYLLVRYPDIGVDMQKMLKAGAGIALLPAVLISFAGLTKSAQMPFSSWLLGAMVAPTPVSALLHSSTMVKAGVFILVKMSPILTGTHAGFLLALVGGITFFSTSILAVTQRNAKRVLAYSTIANLGLITACAGIGTAATLWAAILLIIFHAVSKGLLFLGVGTIEHKIGSRDIEDMGGLIVRQPFLAMVMLIGILGMFLAPFGMLISKWATLQAFVDSSLTLTLLLVFGSAPTLFFWAKWMGKIVGVPSEIEKAGDIHKDESVSLTLLAILTFVSCILFPLAGIKVIDPYLMSIYGHALVIGKSTLFIMMAMLGLLFILPFVFWLAPKKLKEIPVYLAGANLEGSKTFTGSMGIPRTADSQNYYLTLFFKENRIFTVSVVVTILVITAMFIAGRIG